ncbi:AAA family ATPase [Falsiroseomonas sp.]|uniref:AAA family ATPase n=1 Tax=Falsiroseomonas sp. TaxID=2870721 RepID=UPI003F71AF24
MPSDTPVSMMPTEEVDAIRGEVRRVMEQEGLKGTEIAREIGMPYGTFSSWIGGTYAGRSDLKAADAQKWLRTRSVRQETQRLMPEEPRFVVTPTSQDLMVAFQHAQHMPDFAVVVGNPGVGKSTAACQYTRTTPNVFKVVAHPTLSSPRALMEELSLVMNSYQGGSLHRVMRGLVAKLRGRNALIMIDEAQHLTSHALDQLRSIHDAAEVGVVLLGNPTVNGRLEGTGRTGEFAQLTSRVGLRVSRSKPKAGDIEALLDAWAISGTAERTLLTQIAKKPGALRGMTKTLKLAHMLASAERCVVDVSHIKLGYERVGSTAGQEAA